VVLERAEALLLEAIESQNPRQPDRQTEKQGGLWLTSPLRGPEDEGGEGGLCAGGEDAPMGRARAGTGEAMKEDKVNDRSGQGTTASRQRVRGEPLRHI
jgi:hypothetical protein